MDSVVSRRRDDSLGRTSTGVDEYRDSLRKLIETEVKNALEEETRNATKELLEEQRKAVRQIVEEHKLVIKEVVEEEKKAIWARAEALRQSILKLGL